MSKKRQTYTDAEVADMMDQLGKQIGKFSVGKCTCWNAQYLFYAGTYGYPVLVVEWKREGEVWVLDDALSADLGVRLKSAWQ